MYTSWQRLRVQIFIGLLVMLMLVPIVVVAQPSFMMPDGAADDPMQAVVNATLTSGSTTVPFIIYVDEHSLTVYVPAGIPGNTVSLVGLEFQIIFNGLTIPYSLQQQFNSVSLAQIPLPACFRLVQNGETPAIPSACPGTAIYAQFVAPADVFWAANGQSVAFTVIDSGVSLGIFPAGQFQASFNLTVPPTPTPTSTPTPSPSCNSAFSLSPTPTFTTTNGVTHTALITIAEFDAFKLAGGYQWETCWEQPNGWAWAVTSGLTALPAPTTVPPNTPPDAPRVSIEWWEADAYCAVFNANLPTNQQWGVVFGNSAPQITSSSVSILYEWLDDNTSANVHTPPSQRVFSVRDYQQQILGSVQLNVPIRERTAFRCVR
jgi:hypothetical protein